MLLISITLPSVDTPSELPLLDLLDDSVFEPPEFFDKSVAGRIGSLYL